MKKVLIVNGPNLNLTGKRNPEVYGYATLDEINARTAAEGLRLGIVCDFYQSNHEGGIIDSLHQAIDRYDGILLNAGAYTHYSYAIRDAIEAIGLPVIEVHMSNIYQREEFRHVSVIAEVCRKSIVGYGCESYTIALKELNDVIK